MLQRRTNGENLHQIQASVQSIVYRSDNNLLLLHKKDDWVVVPVESAGHLDESEQKRLIHVVQEQSLPTLFAVVLEPLVAVPSVVRVPPTLESLRAFNRDYGHFAFALVPPDVSWIVLCTTDDYVLVGGTEAFVVQALGEDIQESLARFSLFATDTNLPEPLREYLQVVVQSVLHRSEAVTV